MFHSLILEKKISNCIKCNKVNLINNCIQISYYKDYYLSKLLSRRYLAIKYTNINNYKKKRKNKNYMRCDLEYIIKWVGVIKKLNAVLVLCIVKCK